MSHTRNGAKLIFEKHDLIKAIRSREIEKGENFYVAHDLPKTSWGFKWLDFITTRVLGFIQSRMYEGEWNPERKIEVDSLTFSKASWVSQSPLKGKFTLYNASSYAYNSLKDLLKNRITTDIRSQSSKRGELTWNEIEKRYDADLTSHWGIEGRITRVYVGKLARNRAFFAELDDHIPDLSDSLKRLNAAKDYWGDMWNGFGRIDETAIPRHLPIREVSTYQGYQPPIGHGHEYTEEEWQALEAWLKRDRINHSVGVSEAHNVGVKHGPTPKPTIPTVRINWTQ
jgi:hypothetical protein